MKNVPRSVKPSLIEFQSAVFGWVMRGLIVEANGETEASGRGASTASDADCFRTTGRGREEEAWDLTVNSNLEAFAVSLYRISGISWSL